MLHTAASIGRVVQFYHFTIMLIVIHVVLQKKTKNHELLSLRQPALPWSEKNVFKREHVYGGCTFMVSTVVPLMAPSGVAFGASTGPALATKITHRLIVLKLMRGALYSRLLEQA